MTHNKQEFHFFCLRFESSEESGQLANLQPDHMKTSVDTIFYGYMGL